ncbi:MAG TPA: hypothetical protein VKE94_20190 [Gemmataceae bacterium]|nr:hypothetical protein [Gemmataceae bacterium]
MLGVEDFQAEQDYHRGRLARTLLQLHGTGTVSGLLVQTDGNTDVTKLELQVTPGMAIDRVGRIIEVPRTVCIVLQNWLSQYVQAWQNQQSGKSPGTPIIADPNKAIHDGKNLTVDVFATFVACTRELTPCFAAPDDYDATDAFSPNRLLDSFAMQLVLRTDDTPPKTPLDPWTSLGPQQPTLTALRQSILAGTLGPPGKPVEYPPNFDQTAVFLARILVPAIAGTAGHPPVWNLTGFGSTNIDNASRLFLIPLSVLSRWNGLGSGTAS